MRGCVKMMVVGNKCDLKEKRVVTTLMGQVIISSGNQKSPHYYLTFSPLIMEEES